MHDNGGRTPEKTRESRRIWRDAVKAFFGFTAVVVCLSAALYAGSGYEFQKSMNRTAPGMLPRP